MLKGRVSNRITMAHGLMVLAGLVTFVAVSAALADRSATVEVYVAASDLAAGTAVTAQDFTTVSLDVSSPVLGGLIGVDHLPAGRLARDVAAGQPVLTTDVIADHAEAARTMAIPVNSVATSGLGLRPGDSVDVIGVAANGALNFVISAATVTRLPQTASVGGAFNQTTREPFITIEVDHVSALRLAEALRAGDIEIVRSSGAPALAINQTPTPEPATQEPVTP